MSTAKEFLVVAMDTRILDCGLKFIQMQLCDGLGDKTTVSILNISVILKYVSSTFKPERLVYNTALIEAFYYSRIIHSSFYVHPIVPKIILAE